MLLVLLLSGCDAGGVEQEEGSAYRLVRFGTLDLPFRTEGDVAGSYVRLVGGRLDFGDDGRYVLQLYEEHESAAGPPLRQDTLDVRGVYERGRYVFMLDVVGDASSDVVGDTLFGVFDERYALVDGAHLVLYRNAAQAVTFYLNNAGQLWFTSAASRGPEEAGVPVLPVLDRPTIAGTYRLLGAPITGACDSGGCSELTAATLHLEPDLRYTMTAEVGIVGDARTRRTLEASGTFRQDGDLLLFDYTGSRRLEEAPRRFGVVNGSRLRLFSLPVDGFGGYAATFVPVAASRSTRSAGS